MSELGREGRTVIFVSHDLGAVTRLCPRALWLEAGSVRADGPSGSVVERYLAGALPAEVRTFAPEEGRPVSLSSARVLDARGDVAETMRRDMPLTLAVRFAVRERMPPLSIAFIVRDDHGVTVLDEDWGADTGGEIVAALVPQEYEARLTVPPILPAGGYQLEVWIGTPFEQVLRQEVISFHVAPRPGDLEETIRRRRTVQPPVVWAVDELDPAPGAGISSEDVSGAGS
jgi:ABC-2 type transport system ATP-binding protein/lipopolysaccharide transport system ATP-binding protein